MRLKRMAAIMMSTLMLCAAAGCSFGGGNTGGSGNTDDGGNTDVGNPVKPGPDPVETPTDPPSDGYVYGEEHADAYDAAYTESLLAMGEQAFTVAQLSGLDSYMRARTPTGGYREGKYVGLFYFLWQNEGNALYDISKLLEKYGTDVQKSPLWALKGSEFYDKDISPMDAFHYFEEPLYGYYASTDKWVVMKHLELLTYAGIDFLYLDFTNANYGDPDPGNIYPEATFTLLDSILELQAKGIDCPKIVPVVCNPFTSSKNMTPGQARSSVVEWVYRNYYAKDGFKYRSCWFTADKTHNPSGNPLIVSYNLERSDFTDPSIYDAFWIRNVAWPTMVSPDSYQNGFPWMDYSLPQRNYDGFMNVSVAQHVGGSWSSEAYLEALDNDMYPYRGRGARGSMQYSYEGFDPEDANYGLNFNEQWTNALNAKGAEEPWCINVTGWNEWTAQKLDQGRGHSIFVDTFSVEFSRDCEMMRDKSGYADNFYMQLAANASKFKAKSSERKSDAAMWQKTTLSIDDLTAWEKVKAKYLALSGDLSVRDKDSVGHVYHYTDDSARNDIEYVKIANDEKNLYVLVSAKAAITPYEAGDGCWMNLYLSTGKGGWQGYNFVINRSPDGKMTSIEKLSEDEDGKVLTELLEVKAEYAVKDRFIAYSIPLEALGITSKDVIGVKACDNIFGVKKTDENDGVGVYGFGDIEAFYCGGDCAPAGRLNYAYRLAY